MPKGSKGMTRPVGVPLGGQLNAVALSDRRPHPFRNCAATALLLCTIAPDSGLAMTPPPNSTVGPSAGVSPTRYDLDLRIRPQQPTFSGVARITVNMPTSTRVITLNALGLNISRANIAQLGRTFPMTVSILKRKDGQPTGEISLTAQTPLRPGTAQVELGWSGRFRTGPDGMWRTKTDGRWYAFTQFQPIDARRVFPCFDQLTFKTPFSVTIRTDASNKVMSNMPEMRIGPVSRGLIAHRFETSLPLPTYLLAWAIGPLDVVQGPIVPASDLRGYAVPLRGVAPRGRGHLMAFSLQSAAKSLVALEQETGTPFAYPKLDFIAAPGMNDDGMENAGAIVMEEKHLYLNAQSPLEARRYGLEILTHEIAHHWFGNRTTMSTWADLWLNEAFAERLGVSITDRLWPELHLGNSTTVGMAEALGEDRISDPEPMRRNITSDNDVASAFDSITYQKGAQIVAQLQKMLGPTEWSSMLKRHFARYGFQAIAAPDFYASLPQTAAEVTQSFVDRPGFPIINLRRIDATTLEARVPFAGDGQAWTLPFEMQDATGAKISQVLKSGAPAQIKLAGDPLWPNPDGAFYWLYQWDDPAQWDRTIPELAKAPAGAAIIAGESLWQAYIDNQIGFDRLILGARALIKNPDPDAAFALVHHLAWLAELQNDDHTARAIKREIIAQVQPWLSGDQQRASVQLGRSAANETSVWDGPEQADLTSLAQLSKRWMQSQTEVIPISARGTALAAGVILNGPNQKALVDHLTRLFEVDTNPELRLEAAAALGAARNGALVSQFRALLLADELYPDEALAFLASSLHTAGRDDPAGFFPWLTSNLPKILAAMPGLSAQHFAECFLSSPSPAARRIFQETIGPAFARSPRLVAKINRSLNDSARLSTKLQIQPRFLEVL
jgi:Peptidase family M1 domain/Peptidase M1 N-terminal domain